MSAAAKDNTKVEALAEALENLCLGVTNAKGAAKNNLKYLKDARREVRTALRAFLAPSLRLVELGPRQDYTPAVDELDRTKCAECNRHHICADVQCPHWHKAVQGSIAQSVGVGEDEGGDAA